MSKRIDGWNLLRVLNNIITLIPWFCVGDSNEAMSADELNRSNSHPNWQLYNFRNVVYDCSFMNLGWQGYKYTWTNNHEIALTMVKLG